MLENRYYTHSINTPLGELTAIADETHLHLLAFSDSTKLDTQKKKLFRGTSPKLIQKANQPILMIQHELNLYFSKNLTIFTTPIQLTGTNFQKKSWQALINIPYGKTQSYLDEAKAIGNKKAFRAVANANGANPLVIIVPCHRIINHNGKLGGYSAGIKRKEGLLDHESIRMQNDATLHDKNLNEETP